MYQWVQPKLCYILPNITHSYHIYHLLLYLTEHHCIMRALVATCKYISNCDQLFFIAARMWYMSFILISLSILFGATSIIIWNKWIYSSKYFKYIFKSDRRVTWVFIVWYDSIYWFCGIILCIFFQCWCCYYYIDLILSNHLFELFWSLFAIDPPALVDSHYQFILLYLIYLCLY